jgi:NADH-quinone oxidoreductase subunit G
MVTITVDGRGRRRARRAAHRRLRAQRGLHPPVLLPPAHEAGRHVPHVPRRGRHRAGPGAAAQLHDPRATTWSSTPSREGREEGPGRRPRVPARQPPSRLPGLRQGRRVPAAGPDDGLRPGRVPVRRGEAALREADPDLRDVYLDRERCILCDRCTRFANEVAGDPLIHFIDRGNQTEVNTFPDEPFASYFSGNTVQICPVGRSPPSPTGSRPVPGTSRRSSRPAPTTPWAVASPCSRRATRCCATWASTPTRSTGVGCATRSRFGFEAASTRRPARASPLLRGDGRALDAGDEWSDALRPPRRGAPGDPPAVGGRCSAGPGSPTSRQYAWAKLAKGVIGTDNVDAQLGDGLPAELVLGLPGRPSTRCAPGGVVYLGPDPKEELPVLYLRLKHAAVEDGVRASSRCRRGAGLSPYAAHRCSTDPARSQRSGPRSWPGTCPTSGVAGVGADAVRAASEARAIAAVPSEGASVAEPRRVRRHHRRRRARARDAVPGARFLVALRRGNVRGALDMGSPRLLPGAPRSRRRGRWGECGASVPEHRGLDAHGILERAAEGRIDVLVLLGADPLVDVPDRRSPPCPRGCAHGHRARPFVTDSVAQADVVLPVAATPSTTAPHQPRGPGHRAHQKVTPPGTAAPTG